MKHFFLFGLCLLGFTLFSCCEEDDPEEVPVEVNAITGIEKEYTLEQNEFLVINPQVEIAKGDISNVAFEWGIGGRVVSTERELRVQCNKLGTYDGYVKISTSKSGDIYEFKVRVISPSYDRGLLLLSQAEGKAMLTFKRLDKMETMATPWVFKSNNLSASWGTDPLAVCWTGEGITNPNNIGDFGSLYVVVSSDKPQKTYLLDAQTLEIKSEVVYKGSGTFRPELIVSPYGSHNFLWASEYLIYFISGGKEFPYLTEGDRSFINPRKRHVIPAKLRLANVSCNLITTPTDFVRVYYDLNGRRMVYVSGLRGTMIGEVFCGVIPMNLLACNGQYADANANGRYEPREALLVGNDGNRVTIFRFSPASNKAEESLISQIDATGHIETDAATGINPTKPILYYSNSKGNIFQLNYENDHFTDTPYISLGEQFAIRSLLFNPYDPGTLFIAAEDRLEKSEMKASIFVYDVKDNAHARLLFKGHRVGGKIHQMIYKGNGLESLVRH